MNIIDRDDILAALDDERRTAVVPGFGVEATPQVVRHLSLDPARADQNWIAWSRHSAREIDAAIEGEIAHFGALGRSFEWKVYDHDQPADLRRRLAARGFEVGEAEAFMVLDVHAAPDVWLRPITHDVRRLTDPDGLGDFEAIERAVWDTSHASDYALALRTEAGTLELYVAYVAGRPAACARASFRPGGPFCGLWGGATLPEYRNRGLYMALVAARVQEAVRRGVRYVAIDAAPTSRPILEKRGFQFIVNTHPCVFTPNPATAENNQESR